MPLSNGLWTARHNWVSDRNAGIKPSPDRFDEDRADLIRGLNTIIRQETPFTAPVKAKAGENGGYTFDNDSDTGLVQAGGNRMKMRAGGQTVLDVNQNSATLNKPTTMPGVTFGTATPDDTIATKGYVDDVVSDGLDDVVALVLPGTPLPWFGASAPNGYLLCEGQVVSRTTYKKLFDEIGTRFGVGDGSTTFKIPDLRGMFLRGNDNGRGLDNGRTLGSEQSDATAKNGLAVSDITASTVADHSHGLGNFAAGSEVDYNTARSYGSRGASTTQARSTGAAGGHTHTISGGELNDGDPETRPVNVSVNWIIKY